VASAKGVAENFPGAEVHPGAAERLVAWAARLDALEEVHRDAWAAHLVAWVVHRDAWADAVRKARRAVGQYRVPWADERLAVERRDAWAAAELRVLPEPLVWLQRVRQDEAQMPAAQPRLVERVQLAPLLRARKLLVRKVLQAQVVRLRPDEPELPRQVVPPAEPESV
jgi:hypothetical protein